MLLPEADRKVLAGIALVRVNALESSSDDGDTVARYHSSSKVEGTTYMMNREIQVSDKTFAGDVGTEKTAPSFVGHEGKAVPISFQTILHEVGHAVEAGAQDQLQLKKLEAIAASNKASEEYNKYGKAFSEQRDKLTKPLKDERAKLLGAYGVTDDYAKPYNELQGAVVKVYNERVNSKIAQKCSTAEKAMKAYLWDEDGLKAASLKITELKRTLIGGKVTEKYIQKMKLYWKGFDESREKAKARIKQINEYFGKVNRYIIYSNAVNKYVNSIIENKRLKIEINPEGIDSSLQRLTVRYISAASRLQKSELKVEKSKRELKAVYTKEKGTVRLQNFVSLVKKYGIPPTDDVPITAYARKSWPDKPGEYYAEAYSLYLTDPLFLRRIDKYRNLYGFFNQKFHLRDDLINWG